MCGIIGYVGDREASGILLDGLRRVEYRGYDSAGIAVVGASGLSIRRRVGKVAGLVEVVAQDPVHGTVGMGHTRWATHGRPSDENAHPHADCTGTLAVVHNGILENYAELKQRLSGSGHRFRSETDTEVIAHLVETHWNGVASDLVLAVQAALREVRGAYAVAVLAAGAPDQIVAAKHGAGSVVVGLGSGEAFLASDIPALLPLTRDMVILEDGEVAVLSRDGVSMRTLGGQPVARQSTRISWNAELAERGGHPHFMLKEIFDQPRAVRDTFTARLDLEEGRVALPDAALDTATLGRNQACGACCLRDLVSCRARRAVRRRAACRDSCGGRPRLRVPLPGFDPRERHAGPLPSPSRARRPTRLGRFGPLGSAGRPCSRSRTSSARHSLGRPRVSCTPTPVPRSASRRRRRSWRR